MIVIRTIEILGWSLEGGSVDVFHRDPCEFRIPPVGVFGGGDILVVFVAASTKGEEGGEAVGNETE